MYRAVQGGQWGAGEVLSASRCLFPRLEADAGTGIERVDAD